MITKWPLKLNNQGRTIAHKHACCTNKTISSCLLFYFIPSYNILIHHIVHHVFGHHVLRHVSRHHVLVHRILRHHVFVVIISKHLVEHRVGIKSTVTIHAIVWSVWVILFVGSERVGHPVLVTVRNVPHSKVWIPVRAIVLAFRNVNNLLLFGCRKIE